MDKKKQDKPSVNVKDVAAVENGSPSDIKVKECEIIRFSEGFDTYDLVVVVLNAQETQVPIKKGNVFAADKTVKLKVRKIGEKEIVIVD